MEGREKTRDKNTSPIFINRNSNIGGMTHRSNPLTDWRILSFLIIVLNINGSIHFKAAISQR